MEMNSCVLWTLHQNGQKLIDQQAFEHIIGLNATTKWVEEVKKDVERLELQQR